MREYTSPSTAAAGPDTDRRGGLADDVVEYAAEQPDRVAFRRRSPGADGPGWSDVTAATFLAEVRQVARGLVAAGVRPGDRVALMSRTRYEWTLLDYAIWHAGAVGVPVYATAPVDQLRWILEDSDAVAAVVETPALGARVRESGWPDGERHLWVLDDADGPGAVAALTELGREVDDERLERRRTSVQAEDVATIIYTSGTTAHPKGCVLTHANFHRGLGATLAELHELFADEDASTLMVLPMAHVFARVVQLGAVKARVTLGHTPDVRTLPADLATFRPTFLLGVPRVFERLVNAASQQAASEGRGRLFDAATETAIRWSQALDRGRVGPVLRARHTLHDRLVHARVRELLGGRCRFVVSGGAPLGERLGHYFRGIGVPILEGYGLTETTAAVTVNLPDTLRIGTVGRPLPGTSVRVADDGELLVRGAQVMREYWQDEVSTAQALPGDGWLRTGDVGEIDDEGFVRVTGRKKEILVTTSGKNVAAGALEERVRDHPLVDQCLVVGDGRPYVAALVTLDPEAYAGWAADRGLRGPLSAHTDEEALRAEVQAAVDAANATVSQAEAIRRFEVLPDTWSEETGELTASLKLRRNVVHRRYRDAVERLYD
ncbi:AMP-dependent synthetase/ligase [Nocardioides caldifontis]|uniref:AMP-dependent synthetase/ligase n=1 Tax=Nocardioides caldifontis TaxID=2588938 RepID=UPI0011DFE151|nr:AMP-dependent synthetase/ligase [Nocardioides caldifontis]